MAEELHSPPLPLCFLGLILGGPFGECISIPSSRTLFHSATKLLEPLEVSHDKHLTTYLPRMPRAPRLVLKGGESNEGGHVCEPILRTTAQRGGKEGPHGGEGITRGIDGDVPGVSICDAYFFRSDAGNT